uniref:Uncharacterized protein n=1 Tax=Angiostrongylus cantonensis TaxID=6313 RepID=A0A0K0DHZ3_ANGCA
MDLLQDNNPCGNFSDTSHRKLPRLEGSISHVFGACSRTESQDQKSLCDLALQKVSALSELALGHLRYSF